MLISAEIVFLENNITSMLGSSSETNKNKAIKSSKQSKLVCDLIPVIPLSSPRNPALIIVPDQEMESTFTVHQAQEKANNITEISKEMLIKEDGAMIEETNDAIDGFQDGFQDIQEPSEDKKEFRGDCVISLRSLDSDPNQCRDSGDSLKPLSSSRVSFSKKVKAREVGRYIDSSSPSQRLATKDKSRSSAKKRKVANIAYFPPGGTSVRKIKSNAGTPVVPDRPPSVFNSSDLSLISSEVEMNTNHDENLDKNGSEKRVLDDRMNMPKSKPKSSPRLQAESSIGLKDQPELQSWKEPTPKKAKHLTDRNGKVSSSIKPLATSRTVTCVLAYLWENIFEQENTKEIDVKKSKIVLSRSQISIVSESFDVQLTIPKGQILTVQVPFLGAL